MKNIPTIFNNDDFLGEPLNYKWDKKSSDFYAVDAENNKLGVALFSLNHKATFGLATALAELIYWRVSRHVDMPTILPIIVSQWATVIDKHYSFFWKFNDFEAFSSGDNPVATQPVLTMLYILNAPKQAFFEGRFLINAKMDKLAMLARHMSPDPEFFDDWFSNILKKAAKLFSAQYDREEMLKNRRAYRGQLYDSFNEPAIPREFFFDPDYDFKTADNALLINQFLSSLDYQTNPYLNSPEKMIAEGFVGTPYQYQGK